MIKYLKYSKYTNPFKKELSETLSKIRPSQNVYAFSDKTRKPYSLLIETYDDLIQK